jgi:restriction system protein
VAEITRRRSGELIRGVFQVLAGHPEGLQARDVLAELEQRVPPTSFEQSFYRNHPGIRRYEKIVRFMTIAHFSDSVHPVRSFRTRGVGGRVAADGFG